MYFADKITEIPFSSALYPKEWKRLSDAPEKVYAVGNVSLLTTRKFALVGSRRTPAPILTLTASTAKELSHAFTLATGTADGGDSAAIEGALAGSGNIICVLAGGFSSIPQNNFPLLKRVAEQGLLISPHPYETGVRSFSYEHRNKLLAALAEGVLVTSAGEKSGALITAKYAESFQKPIFAFPYAPNSLVGAGCNALLKKGARLVENSLDVCAWFGINLTEKKTAPALTGEETKLLNALKERTEAHISELSAQSGVPLFKARALLSALEVKGLVASLGGNCYAPV